VIRIECELNVFVETNKFSKKNMKWNAKPMKFGHEMIWFDFVYFIMSFDWIIRCINMKNKNDIRIWMKFEWKEKREKTKDQWLKQQTNEKWWKGKVKEKTKVEKEVEKEVEKVWKVQIHHIWWCH